MENRHKIFLVDDHPLVREGLRVLLAQEPDLEICGSAETGAEAYTAIAAMQPDAVIVDLSLGGDSGLDLIKRLQDLPKVPPTLVLSMHDEAHYAERALRAGALAYVMKRETSGKVVRALREVIKGKIFVSSAFAEKMTSKLVGSRPSLAASPVETLSDRELEVFTRLGQGYATRRIAEELHLSLKTIHTYCAHLKQKLDLENATALVHEAVRWVESQKNG